MSTQYEDLFSALEQHLETLASPPPIAFQNRDLVPEPDETTTWIRPSMLLTEPVVAELGDTGRIMQKGIFQVSIFAPKNVGIGNALALADSVIQLFKKGTVLSYGTVTDLKIEKSYLGPEVPDDRWYHRPVNISFWSLLPSI